MADDNTETTPEYDALVNSATEPAPDLEPAPDSGVLADDVDGVPVGANGRDTWQGRASDTREIPTLGVRGGLYHYSFLIPNLDTLNDPGQHAANQGEVARQAANSGWLVTEPAKIVDTAGSQVIYAAPVVQNNAENSARLFVHQTSSGM
jgi:hypothetical protein